MSQLFVVCFVACLFAFIAINVVRRQVDQWVMRRLFGPVADQPPALTKQEMDRILAKMPRMPHLLVTCRCGHQQSVSCGVPPVAVLEPSGWRWDEKIDGWACPQCTDAPVASEVA